MIGSQMLKVIECFMRDVPNKQAKRHSIVEGAVTRLVYYSSTIAKRENNRLFVTLDGFNTASTASRNVEKHSESNVNLI